MIKKYLILLKRVFNVINSCEYIKKEIIIFGIILGYSKNIYYSITTYLKDDFECVFNVNDFADFIHNQYNVDKLDIEEYALKNHWLYNKKLGVATKLDIPSFKNNEKDYLIFKNIINSILDVKEDIIKVVVDYAEELGIFSIIVTVKKDKVMTIDEKVIFSYEVEEKDNKLYNCLKEYKKENNDIMTSLISINIMER